MLKLRRKVGENIYITVPGRKKPILISVLSFLPDTGYGPKVNLGFDADNDIEIQREELYEERGNK